MENKERVCAVVVTYNRKKLLIECLDALCKQTRSIDAIYIIDNFSNDGTAELLLENGYINKLPPENLVEPFEIEIDYDNGKFLGAFDDGIEFKEAKLDNQLKIYYVRMNENTGGAGGFYEGVKRGYEKGYDWLWLMDDDTIPFDNANEALLSSIDIAQQQYQDKNIGFAISKVWFNSKDIHLMNLPQLQPVINGLPFNQIENRGILLIPAGSFVSMMISNKAINLCGLPIKEFFIWGDDIEYSSRITNKEFLGLYCRNSNVVHKTKENYSSNIYKDNIKNIWKYYYGIRNQLLIKKRDSYLKYLVAFFKNIFLTNVQIIRKRDNNKFSYMKVNTYATISSLLMKI